MTNYESFKSNYTTKDGQKITVCPSSIVSEGRWYFFQSRRRYNNGRHIAIYSAKGFGTKQLTIK